jgi:hypothetical protein
VALERLEASNKSLREEIASLRSATVLGMSHGSLNIGDPRMSIIDEAVANSIETPVRETKKRCLSTGKRYTLLIVTI